jgi:biofilm PGA synthesis N-glycosyltransferase PgaC
MTQTLLVISLILILHSYIIYPMMLYVGQLLVRSKNRLYPQRAGSVHVTVIISVYNEAKIIRQRIENLLALNYPKEHLEILIGSDGSSDETNTILRDYEGTHVRAVYYPERRGKASVLNDLVEMAKNEVIIFSDANTFYDHDVIQRFIPHFSDESIGGVCGYLRLRSAEGNSGGKGESFYWEYENLLKEWEGSIHTTFGATGAIYAIRRSLYIPLPKDKVIADDFIVPMNIVGQGYRICYDKLICGWEDATESAKSEFQRKIRIGAANFNGISMIAHLLHPRYGFISFGLFSHKIIRWCTPFFLMIIFVSIILLRSESETFGLLFSLQILFLISAFIGYVLDGLHYPVKIFTLPYYFLLANLGILIGFVRFVRGTQKAAWNATR